MTTDTDITFVAPGPGRWALDLVHHPGGMTRFVAAVMPPALTAGFGEAYRRYGIPLAGVDQQLVNGFVYSRPVPLIEPRGKRQPPDLLLRLGPLLHPRLRARRQATAKAVEARLWLDDLETWSSQDRPPLRSALEEAGAADLASISNVALAELIERSAELIGETSRLHFVYDGAYLAVVGLLLGREIEAGNDAVAVVASLVDTTGATRAPDHNRAELAAAIGNHRFATLAELRSHSIEARDALDDFLAEFGNRVVHRFDIDSRTLAELPDLILALGATNAVDQSPRTVPAFSPYDRTLWNDAQAVLGLRDDTAGYVQWALGVARRAVLETGQRLTATGCFQSESDAFLFEPGELRGLLTNEDDGLSGVVEERREASQLRQTLNPPPVLGHEPPPPSPDLLPSPQRQMAKGLVVYAAMHFESGTRPLAGFGIGDTPVTGPAFVIGHDDEGLDAFTPGDILVIPMTTPAHNTIAALAAGIVTDAGGLLSHAAIIAREFAKPAVIGTTSATTTIATGDLITIDPGSGSVHLHIESELRG